MAVRTRAGAGRAQGLATPPRYEVRGQIASGGMGTVWGAYDTLLRREVAIKVLSEGLAEDPQTATRFRREALAAGRLSSHPHVVSIYDVGNGNPVAEEGAGPLRPFLVMERLPGETVADALDAGPVQTDHALRWLSQAAAALDFAHRHDVVHRDIKPHNFLLDAAGDLRIADFGVAMIGSTASLTRTGQLIGTAAYVSPEQAMGEPATAASDRYSLAVVAFELLVGERPFTASNPVAQLRKHVDEEPPRPSALNPRLPRAVDSVLARGMSKRPQDRYSSTVEFVDALKAALAEPQIAGAVTAPLPLAVTRAVRTPARPEALAPRRARASIAAALVCVAALVAFVVLVVAQPARHQLARSAHQPAIPASRPRVPQHSPRQPQSSAPAPTTSAPSELPAPTPAVSAPAAAEPARHTTAKPRSSHPVRGPSTRSAPPAASKHQASGKAQPATGRGGHSHEHGGGGGD